MKKISFVVIAFNEEKNIANCINSILKQKGLKDYEIIVVNDGSKDRTPNVVLDFVKGSKKIKLIDLKINHGRGFARSKGVSMSCGEIISFVDADIILPNYWLETCAKYISEYDAVGGIAKPDGDVSYIYKKFNLKPKTVKHTTEITGSNSLIKSSIFKKVKINQTLTNGEDVDFIWRVKSSGLKVKSISNLIVLHNENRTFVDSLRWLFQSGVGASKLFNRYKKVRLPDITLVVLLGLLILSILSVYFFNIRIFLVIPIYIFLVSAIHILSKFEASVLETGNLLTAFLVNTILLTSYFVGRIIGIFNKK